jgi:hypothetical protein
MNPLSCMFSPKGFLINSERLGPTNEEQIEYSVKVTAGKKIRFNVRDSVNPGYEGTAFTDVITISESLYRQDETEIQLREAIILVSKAVLLVSPLSLCKYSQCMSADLSPLTTTGGSGNPDAPPPFLALRYPHRAVASCPLHWPRRAPLFPPNCLWHLVSLLLPLPPGMEMRLSTEICRMPESCWRYRICLFLVAWQASSGRIS